MQLTTLENASIVHRTNAAGNDLGQRIHFVGTSPAADIRKQLKAANPRLGNKDLKAKVAEVLTGKSGIAWMTFDAMASAARSDGFIQDYTDVNKAGNKLVARFVKPASSVTAQEAVAAKDAELATLKAELDALKATFAEVVEASAAVE